MQYLTGGSCSNACSCAYAGSQCSSGDSYYGGSSDNANGQANADAMNSKKIIMKKTKYICKVLIILILFLYNCTPRCRTIVSCGLAAG
jgi:hypothetical protein